MKLLLVVVHARWQSATREGTTAAYADGIARVLANGGGGDLRAVRLTAQGLVAR